jgi:hypothetical protein
MGIKSQGPQGVGTFQGVRVALWTIPMLQHAQQNGWKGSITSGYRPPGGSEHQGTQYPHGAIDFGGPGPVSNAAGQNRAAFFAAAGNFAGYQLIPAQFGPYSKYPQGDSGHSSGTGH